MVKSSKLAAIRPIQVRMAESLRRRLASDAERNGRSMNSEITYRLEHSFDRQSLLEQVLKLAYGPRWAAFLAKAHEHDLLGFSNENKAALRTVMMKFIDSLPEPGKGPVEPPTDEEFEAAKRAHGDK